jgi:hypothetical protein
VVDDGPRRIPELRSLLSSAQIPFDEIAQASPSIEDLFVSAVEAEKKAVAR